MAGNLADESVEALTVWHLQVKGRDYTLARDLAASMVTKCCDFLRQTPIGIVPASRDVAHVFGVLFRGLEDLMVLAEITNRPGWQGDHGLVERAWGRLCDAKARLAYVASVAEVHHEAIALAEESIPLLDRAFLRAYGPGMYASPEILIRKSHCSVCSGDPRACEHVPGEIYDGTRCAVVADEIDPLGVAIVEAPKDPRCRLWPWNFKIEGGVARGVMAVMTPFRVDDFMYEAAST